MRNHAHSNSYCNGIRKDFVSQGSPSSTLVTRLIISFFPSSSKCCHQKTHTSRSWPFFLSNDLMMSSHTRLCLHINKCIQFKYRKENGRGLIEPLKVTTELYRGRGIWDRNTTYIYTPLALTTMMCEREKFTLLISMRCSSNQNLVSAILVKGRTRIINKPKKRVFQKMWVIFCNSSLI